MNKHRATGEVGPLCGGRKLKRQRFELHSVVVSDDALMFGGEKKIQIDSSQRDEGGAFFFGAHGEALVEVRPEDSFEVVVGSFVVDDALDFEFLRESALNREEGALTAASGLRAESENLANAEGVEHLRHLALLDVIGAFPSSRGATEVGTSVGVEFAKPAVVIQHAFNGLQRRQRAFLRDKSGEQHAAISVIESDHQVLFRLARNPLVRRGIEVHHHARHGPPFPFATVFSSRSVFLGQPCILQKHLRPGVRNTHAMFADEKIVEVLN